MHRIDADSHVGNLFDGGDPLIPRNPTQVDADWLNAVQEELANAITGLGWPLAKGTNTQLLDILRRLPRAWCRVTFNGAAAPVVDAAVGISTTIIAINYAAGAFGLTLSPGVTKGTRAVVAVCPISEPNNCAVYETDVGTTDTTITLSVRELAPADTFANLQAVGSSYRINVVIYGP